MNEENKNQTDTKVSAYIAKLFGWAWANELSRNFWLFVCGFIMGNWIYQVITLNFNWVTAFERSYFQLMMALAIQYFVIRKANAQSK